VRRIGFPWSPQLVERSKRSVGGTIAAASAALEDGAAANLAGGTHHAFSDRGEGFCVFNDVAVAAREVQSRGAARRVAVLDLDVHQGNGTAAIFADDPETFTYSIHQENNYPIKERSDLDRGLPDRIEDEAYLALLAQDLDHIDAHFEPDLVWYLAGVDPYERDQLGGLWLTAEGLRRRDAFVLERYAGRGLPIAISLAGGYAPSPQETAELHMGTVRVAEELV